jgi:galactokinase
VIALVPAAERDAVTDAVRRATRDAGFVDPAITRTHAGAGAGRQGR